MDPEINQPDNVQAAAEQVDMDDGSPLSAWSDTRLVRECLGGNQEAWAALIHKYQRLIYSIPIKYGASRDDAADIFQAVCLELFSELSKLRKTESLKSWLMTVAAHQAYHWKRRQRGGNVELDSMEPDLAEAQVPARTLLPPELLEEVEREQKMREAFAQLPKRCVEMMRLLFYVDPPLPYAEVARRLGLATGSIGFIRGRCLKKLEKILLETGF